jgi:hypothetical protein
MSRAVTAATVIPVTQLAGGGLPASNATADPPGSWFSRYFLGLARNRQRDCGSLAMKLAGVRSE